MYRDRQPFEKEGDSTLTAIKIFLVIFLAISLSWLIREAYIYWMVEQAGLHPIPSRNTGPDPGKSPMQKTAGS